MSEYLQDMLVPSARQQKGQKMFQINREHVKKMFQNYTNHYDSSDDKISLKIVHTFHVADLCDRLSESLGLNSHDTDLAWLIGVLHDIGRFEQLRRYETFQDALSIDHAEFGNQLLFENRLIRSFLNDNSEDETIRKSILYHNKYRLPEDLDERTLLFVNLIRDADKIDILRVNIDFPLETIYNIPKEKILQSEVSPAVMESFMQEHAVEHQLKVTPVDHLAGHASLVFELVYPESFRIVIKQGYLKKLLQFHSENPVTQEQFKQMSEKLDLFIQKRIS